jgi:GNAT superfamily N-acetyltransferase
MIRIRPMTLDDLPLGMHLKARAGWNQTEADWRRFLSLGDGFVAEWDGAAVGTTMTFLFGPVAWVAMVLVDEAVRGRGIGTALMRHALAHLDGRGVKSVRLDATPLGRPVYEKLGFVADYTLHRYEGIPPDLIEGPLVTTALCTDDWPDVLGLDRHVTGTAREALLHCLQEEDPNAFRVYRQDGEFVGFVAWRPGAQANLIGPCLAVSFGDQVDMLMDAFRYLAGRRVFIDVPQGGWSLATDFVEKSGLTAQRAFLRMTRGEMVREDPDLLWATSGPEKG